MTINNKQSKDHEKIHLVKNRVGIYLLFNKRNKKSYVGGSTNILNRLRNYTSKGLLNHKPNSKINKALHKHGFSNFSLHILEHCELTQLREREQYYIDAFRPRYNTRRSIKR